MASVADRRAQLDETMTISKEPTVSINGISMEENPTPYPTKSLETIIRSRHSIREFTSQPVPEQLLWDCLSLAQQAPSNSNIQPWRLYLASGAARERIVSALSAVAREHGPNIPPIPEPFNRFRVAMGKKLYGDEGYGLRREDTESRLKATLRNYEFFGAPVCGVITMSSILESVDAMTVGMFVQILLLALVEKGLGTCLQISVTGYPEVLRREFGIKEDDMIFCGIVIGWPKPGSRLNELVIEREEVGYGVTFLRE